jgi:hypothetical protein
MHAYKKKKIKLGSENERRVKEEKNKYKDIKDKEINKNAWI